MARQLRDFGGKQTGLDQYAIGKFADSLEVVPRTIAENSGALPALPPPSGRICQRLAVAVA